MILKVKPSNFLGGSVNLPASKSYSIRAFIIAACGGDSMIYDPSNCDDAVVACKTAQKLGCKIHQQQDNFKITHNAEINKNIQFNVGESGTVLRFLLPLAAHFYSSAKIVGSGTLIGRPNEHLVNTLKSMGVRVSGTGKKQSIPILIDGGQISGGKHHIDGSLSSQFISALLITCPMLEQDTTLKLTGSKIVSADYIQMTLQVLSKAGIKIIKNNSREYFIQGRQRYKGLKSFKVPSDFGLAAFLLAAASLIPSKIQLKGHLDQKLVQADGHIFRILNKMGVAFRQTSKSIKIDGPFQLKGGVFSLKDCPDLVPIISILCLFAKGRSRLTDIKHARVKESDRISDLRKELVKIGADVQEKSNELIINPLPNYKNNCVLDPHHDHRLAMSFAVLGLKLGVQVKDIECTHKSYPDFTKDFRQLGVVFSRSSR